MKKPPLIILAGPTASGKSNLSIRLAKRIGGQIISADSMQVYKRMDIGTAKITPEKMQGIRHYLIDVLEPDEEFNILLFKQLADKAVSEIQKEGKIPILVGGTGFYIQSVLYDIDFNIKASDPEVREKLKKDLEEKGIQYLFDLLEKNDPESAKLIHMNNTRRVIRALEYYYSSGMRISEHNKAEKEKISPYDFRYFVLCMDRQKLYRRIDRRVDRMIEQGLLEEVKKLRQEGLNEEYTSMQGLGYKEFLDYIDGRSTYDDAVEKIKTESRHYAKRQITWFKREKEAKWIDIDKFDMDYDRVCEYILTMLGENWGRPDNENDGNV